MKTCVRCTSRFEGTTDKFALFDANQTRTNSQES